MGSPTSEYLVRQARIDNILKSLVLPREVSYEYGLSSLEPGVCASADAGIETREPERRQTYTTGPPNVVDFHSGKKIIGRVYFTRNPVEVQSLDGMFAETETTLRQRLGL